MARPARITHSMILTAARQLIRQIGWEAFTLLRLARVLKVKPPSLHNHIAGLDGLRRDLAVEASRELVEQLTLAAVGKSGHDAIRALAHAYRNYVLQNPTLLPAIARAPAPDDAEHRAILDRIIQVGMAIMAEYGLERSESIHAIRAMRSAVHGFVELEISGGFGSEESPDKSFEWLVERLLPGQASKA